MTRAELIHQRIAVLLAGEDLADCFIAVGLSVAAVSGMGADNTASGDGLVDLIAKYAKRELRNNVSRRQCPRAILFRPKLCKSVQA